MKVNTLITLFLLAPVVASQTATPAKNKDAKETEKSKSPAKAVKRPSRPTKKPAATMSPAKKR
jgi:hypothetical protein